MGLISLCDLPFFFHEITHQMLFFLYHSVEVLCHIKVYFSLSVKLKPFQLELVT